MKKLSKKYIKTIKDDKGNITGYGLKGNLESLKQELDQAGQHKKVLKKKDQRIEEQARRIAELSSENAKLKFQRTCKEAELEDTNKKLKNELETSKDYANYYRNRLAKIQEIARINRYNCFGIKNWGYENYQRINDLCTSAFVYIPRQCEMILGAPIFPFGTSSTVYNSAWSANFNGYKVV
nr:MAG TPA: hypothetical protein [Caudoviricetes sp.]